MAIRTNIEDVDVRIDPLSFTADITVLWGNTTQVGNGLEDGYMPSRVDVPCVLLPVVEVADPDNFITGRQKLTACYWYEGEPKKDDSNLITASTSGYEINTEAGPNQYALTVRKNFAINTSQIIHARFVITDVRTNTRITIDRQVTFHTVEYDENMLHVQLTDCPAVLRIDPFDEADCGEAPWNHVASVQMYRGQDPYDDAKTVYKWQIFDNDSGKYRDFTADEKSVLVSGVDTKSLTFDARFMEKEGLRCIAKPSDRPGWEYPLYTHVSVDVKIAETVMAEVSCIKGLRISPRMDEEVAYRCDLSYNKGLVKEAKYGLFRITWMAKDDKIGATAKKLGTGRSVTFVPKDYGFDSNHYISVYAEVELRKKTALVVNGFNKVITSNNKILVTNIYE